MNRKKCLLLMLVYMYMFEIYKLLCRKAKEKLNKPCNEVFNEKKNYSLHYIFSSFMF